MKNELKHIAILLPGPVILAVLIGNSLTSDAAAVVAGGLVGIVAAGVFALVVFIIREERAMRTRQSRERRENYRPQRPRPAEPPAASPRVIDTEWREINDPQLPGAPAETTAIVRVSASKTVQHYR